MSINYGLFKSAFKKTIAEAMYNEIISKTSRYYHFLGKENSWTDFLSPFIPSSLTDIPGPPQDNFRYECHVRRDILTTKLIKTGDVSFVAPRYDWTYGLVYDMYDDAYTATAPAYSGAIRLEDAKFYVITNEYNVYKCISNNNDSPSTIPPIGADIDIITMTDGYMWKFMYTIPVSLRNRFLSTEYIPVSTALRSQYYSGGKIVAITIDSGGSNYLSEILGSGTISSSTVSHTVTGVSTYFVTQVHPGYILKKADGNQIGIVASIESNTSLTLVSNAAYTLTTQAYKIAPPQSAYIVVTGDGYIENNPYIINNIVITNPGDGYSFVPNIVFSTPDVISGLETLATGEVTLDSGAIDTTTLLVSGYGYSGLPTILVDEPRADGVEWTPTTVVTTGHILTHLGRYYAVTDAGTTGTVPPTHTSGEVIDGTAKLTYEATLAVLTADIVKTEADLSLVITDGEITGIVINDGGIGYTIANLLVVDTNHPNPTDSTDLTNAFLSVDLAIGNVNTLQANVELLAVPGTLEVIKVVNAGTGYVSPIVTIVGDGTGATATAIVTGGLIVGYEVVNPGSGYTWTDVQIDGLGYGVGAVARAIMSPIKGHGKNAINELNADSIMFYSTIGRDTNHGMIVTNDYRKAGLLKNITYFDTTYRYTEDVGSGCIKITGIFDITKLAYDMLLVDSVDTYKHYRIVEFNSTEILISVFNNFSINIFSTLVTPNADPIYVTNVEERTINQFSGDLLFLSVREPFAPSDEQIITVRTVVTI